MYLNATEAKTAMTEKLLAKGEELYSVRELANMYNDHKNKVYLTFCNDLLQDILRQNVNFQAENANCLQLISDLRYFYESLLRKFVLADRLERHPSSDILNFQFERYTCAASMVDFGIDFRQMLHVITDPHVKMEIMERCKSCLIEAASQVKKRIPDSLDSLCLLQYLSLEAVLKKTKLNIDALLTQFPSLVPDPSQTEREYRNLRFSEHLPDRALDPVEFWLAIQEEKDAGDNSRFENISALALALFTMPFSNASVERVFSMMSLVKTKVRNKLLCETVESVLFVRYGIDFLGDSLLSFMSMRSMIRNFSDKIYHADKFDEKKDGDIGEALDIIKECNEYNIDG